MQVAKEELHSLGSREPWNVFEQQSDLVIILGHTQKACWELVELRCSQSALWLQAQSCLKRDSPFCLLAVNEHLLYARWG